MMRDEILQRLERLRIEMPDRASRSTNESYLDAAIADIRGMLQSQQAVTDVTGEPVTVAEPVTVYVGKTIRHTPYVGDTVTLNKAFTTEAAAYAWIAGDSDRDFEELELIPDAQGGTDAK